LVVFGPLVVGRVGRVSGVSDLLNLVYAEAARAQSSQVRRGRRLSRGCLKNDGLGRSWDVGSSSMRSVREHLARSMEVGLQLMRVLCLLCVKWSRSQASEGVRGMPGHTEARKAAVSCDKPGGGAHVL
jgi:hypothetical protein